MESIKSNGTPIMMTRRKLRLQKQSQLDERDSSSKQSVKSLEHNSSPDTIKNESDSLQTFQSLPDLNNTEDYDLQTQCDRKIQKIKIELESAHQEIINLNEENNKLKTDLTDLHKKMLIYKNMCEQILSGPRKECLNSNNGKNGSQSKINKLEKCKVRLDFSEEVSGTVENSQGTEVDNEVDNITNKKNKYKNKPKLNQKLQRKIKRQNKVIKSLKNKNKRLQIQRFTKDHNMKKAQLESFVKDTEKDCILRKSQESDDVKRNPARDGGREKAVLEKRSCSDGERDSQTRKRSVLIFSDHL